MANIILTNHCNLNCPFCFATENNYGLAKNTKEEFCVSDIWKISSFLKDKTIRLCGGEPTLNSNIIEIIDCLLTNDFNILLMTNGLWTENFKNYYKSLPIHKNQNISHLFNILEKNEYTKIQYQNLLSVLDLVNPTRSTLGTTIYKRDFEYKHLIELCEKFSIKSLRISISAPNLTDGDYKIEDEYYFIADKLHKFLIECSASGIQVNKDCNYIPPCFFSEKQLLDIKFSINGNWNFTCANSPVDIDVEGNTWRCYGLYSLLRANIKDFKKESELKNYFNRRMRLISTNLYAYEECKDCPYWQKSCLGGCFTIRIKKALKENPELTIVPIDDDNEILNCKPKRNKSLVIKKSDTGEFIYHDNCILDNSNENLLIFIKTIDGKTTVKQLIDMWSSNFDNYEEAKTEVVNMCRALFEKDIIDIVYNYNILTPKRQKKDICYI